MHDKFIHMLWKYPGLYREKAQDKTLETMGNIFHQAVRCAVVTNSERDKADVRVLRALIEHDISYCSKQKGTFNNTLGKI